MRKPTLTVKVMDGLKSIASFADVSLSDMEESGSFTQEEIRNMRQAIEWVSRMSTYRASASKHGRTS